MITNVQWDIFKTIEFNQNDKVVDYSCLLKKGFAELLLFKVTHVIMKFES